MAKNTPSPRSAVLDGNQQYGKCITAEEGRDVGNSSLNAPRQEAASLRRSPLDDKSEGKEEQGEASHINIREAIIQGSFLPVTLLSLAGKFPINDYVID